jgi:hypothetical protein
LNFNDQVAADLDAIFLNPAEFGESVTYFPRGGSPRPVVAVVDRSLLQKRPGQSHTTYDEEISVFCKQNATTGINDPQIGDGLLLAEDAADQRWDFDQRLHVSMGGITLRFKRSRLQRSGFARSDQL